MKEKLVALLLVASLVLIACSSEEEGADLTSPDSGTNALSITIQQDIFVEDYETNYLTNLIEETFDTELEFLVLPIDTNDANSKFSLMVSSGSELPDVVNKTFTNTAAYDYATKGIFLETTPYFTDPEKMPNFLNIPESEREVILNTAKLADGKNYGFPKYQVLQWNESFNRFWVRTPWLEELGLEVPTTTDEFYEVAKAFVNQDPNGNGKKDEIGVLGATGWGQNPMVFLMNAFTYANPDKSYFAVENEQIVASFTKPEWKEGLEYMNMLVSEGLLDPLTFTQDNTQLKGVLTSDENGVAGFVPAGSYAGTFASSPITLQKMDLMEPITGPNGEKNAPRNPTTSTTYWYLTKDCKNIDLAIEIADFFYQPNISLSSQAGEEGVDWTQDPEILSQYEADNATLGYEVGRVSLIDIWGIPQNKMWADRNPHYRSLEVGLSAGTNKIGAEADPFAIPNLTVPYVEMYVPAFPNEVIYTLPYTPEELEGITNAKVAIDEFVKNMATAFITGNRPLSDWDSYLDELDKMGLQEYTATTQAAYDRSR